MVENNTPRVRTLAQLRSLKKPPGPALVSPWFRQAESALIYGPSGLGKTMFVMTLGLMVAGGGRAMGWRNDRPRKVLIIDGEMSVETLSDRADTLAMTIDGLDNVAKERNLVVMAATDPDGGVMPDLNTSDGHSAIRGLVKEHGVDLLILDNFSALSSCDDENSASAMKPLSRFLVLMKILKVAVVLVHHSGKSGKGYRGSSSLEGPFDVAIGLEKAKESMSGGASFRLALRKRRNPWNEKIGTKSLRLDSDGARPRWIVDGDVAVDDRNSDDRLQRYCGLVRSGLYATDADIAKVLGVSPATVSRLRRKATKTGMITEDSINSSRKSKSHPSAVH